MSERFCTVGEIELCFETFGSPNDPALLLIMGLGTQMIAWHESFCEELAGRGFHVIRYDNRDCGRSTAIDGAPPTVSQIVRRSKAAARYTLDDMAADAAGLLDHLGVERAHVVGASMGGMIAQQLAATRPERVLSLVSIMSTTGSRVAGQPSPRVLPVLLRRAPKGLEPYVDSVVGVFAMIGSPGFDRDEDEIRNLARASYERGISAAGTGRQLAAIIASGNRTPLLRRITAPTLVIHGDKDRLVPLSGGKATAKAIPGAELMVVRGMGHDLPRGAWPQILDAIERNTRRAGPREPDPAAA